MDVVGEINGYLERTAPWWEAKGSSLRKLLSRMLCILQRELQRNSRGAAAGLWAVRCAN